MTSQTSRWIAEAARMAAFLRAAEGRRTTLEAARVFNEEGMRLPPADGDAFADGGPEDNAA